MSQKGLPVNLTGTIFEMSGAQGTQSGISPASTDVSLSLEFIFSPLNFNNYIATNGITPMKTFQGEKYIFQGKNMYSEKKIYIAKNPSHPSKKLIIPCFGIAAVQKALRRIDKRT